MKYESTSAQLILEIQKLINEINKQKKTITNLKKYKKRKNNIKKKYNSTVVNFKRNHNKIFKNIGKTPPKLNQLPKVQNMNNKLQNIWWNHYSTPTVTPKPKPVTKPTVTPKPKPKPVTKPTVTPKGVQTLLKNSGIKVTQSTSSSQKKVTVSK